MLQLLKRSARDFMDDECPLRAAALAYYTIFALPPLLILLIMVAGLLWDPADVQRALETQFAGLVGPDGAAAIQAMVARTDQPGSGGPMATVFSVAGLMFGATGAFIQLQGALNRAWEVQPDPDAGGVRQFLTKRVLSLGMVFGIGFLLAVSLAVSAILSAAGGILSGMLGGPGQPLLHAINFSVTLAVMALLFAAIFRFLPDARIAWRDVMVGGAATAVLFVAGKYVIGLYLGRSDPGDAYGAASTLAVLLIWIYYAAMILLFGAEFTQSWAERRGGGIEPEPGAVTLREAQQKKLSRDDREMRRRTRQDQGVRTPEPPRTDSARHEPAPSGRSALVIGAAILALRRLTGR
jgi:membrane protein